MKLIGQSLAGLMLLVPTVADGQPRYEPSHEPPLGHERILIFVSSSGCVANHEEEFDDAVRQLKAILAERAAENGQSFSAVGVAVEWDVERGTDYLLRGRWSGGALDFGPFDEIVVGRNWGNSAAVRYLQDLSPNGCPSPAGIWQAVPQLFLVDREAEEWRADGEFRYGPERLLLQACGADEIIKWMRQGAPIP